MAILILSTGGSMSKRPSSKVRLFIWLLSLTTGFAVLNSSAAPVELAQALKTNQPPALKPDYRDIIIPPNIAPLNFSIQEPGSRFYVRVHGRSGESIELSADNGKVIIPLKPWRRLLNDNRGGAVQLDIYSQHQNKQWIRYTSITNRVASEDIDPVLIYRKIHPAHSTWSSMG